jgi:hypothetical protein
MSQPSIHKQIQSLSEYTKLCTVNDMLRSFYLENNNENLEQQEDNPFDYSLQSAEWLPCYQKHLLHDTAGNKHHVNLCLSEI